MKSPRIFCSKKGYEPCFQLQGSNFLLSCLNPFSKRMLLFSCLQKVINCLKMTNCNRRPRYLLNVFQSSENVFHSRQDSHDGRQQVLNADFISCLFSRPIFFLICYGNFLTLTLHQHGYGIMYANEYETKKKTKIT